MTDQAIPNIPLGEMLALQANENPNYEVFRFIKRGKKAYDSMTYAQLHKRAISIAQHIETQVQPGDRIFLIYQPGLEYIAALFACFYLGIIPVPAYPPNPKKLKVSVERLNVMIEDSQPTLILTSTLINTVIKSIQVKDNIQKRFGKSDDAIDLKQVPIINTQKIKDSSNIESFKPFQANIDDIALLLYTSGSTGHPKGIEVLHGNVHANIIFQQRHIDQYELNKDMYEVIWLPHQHSLCLIGFILRPVYLSTHMVLFSPLDFLADPLFWFDVVTEYKAAQTIAPNFALDMVRDKATPKRLQAINLSSLKSLGIGGAAVTKETIDLFIKTFKPYGLDDLIIFPCYGLSEAVVGVCGYKALQQNINIVHKDELNLEASGPFKDIALSNEIVSNGGWPEDLSEVIIVNPDTLEAQDDKVIGEIWVKNNCIAKGYWNKPEASKETFGAKTKDGKGPYLRTGDLGFIDNNELYIVERLKDLIVIRGKNFIPNDIEQAIMKTDPRLHVSNVAFSYLDKSDEQLIVACEVEKKHLKHQQELINKIKETIVSEFDISPKEVLILEKDSLPKTVSGKIQRQRYKKTYIENLNKSIHEEEKETQPEVNSATKNPILNDEQPTDLLPIIIKVLKKLDVDTQYIHELEQGHDVGFAQIGLDSLKLMEFYSDIFAALNIDMLDYSDDVTTQYFIYDKSIFDTITSLQKFMNQEVEHSNKIATKKKQPQHDVHPDLIKPEVKKHTLKNKSGQKYGHYVIKQVQKIKDNNFKKLSPLERQLLNNIHTYIHRYLPNNVEDYQEDIKQVFNAIVHMASLYNSYGLNESKIYAKIENFVRHKAFNYGIRYNQRIVKPFKDNLQQAKLVFFMHTPFDFAGVFVLVSLLDKAGIKTGLLTKESSYEGLVEEYGLKHCLVWDITKKRSSLGISQMVSENRVIFMAPDSFAAIYSKKASRFNISKLFPQKQPYVKNAILNDLLHKNFFMFISELHHMALHFDLPIYSLSGFVQGKELHVNISDPIKAEPIDDHNYVEFLQNILRSKMPYFIEQLDVFLQLESVIDYYTTVNDIT